MRTKRDGQGKMNNYATGDKFPFGQGKAYGDEEVMVAEAFGGVGRVSADSLN